MNRRTAREKALQALFQMDISETDVAETVSFVLNGEEEDEFLLALVTGVTTHKEIIDQLIRDHLEKWALERLANVDRHLLRIAVYELKYSEDVPDKVVLNEAIELAKVFGDDESSRFVNGVLSKIKDSLRL